MDFMLSNSFLNTNVQKAFMKNILGYTEPFHKLAVAVQEAHRKHKLITTCWLDLANAYGSIHHDFTLQHYHTPPCFSNVVASLCCNLSAVVTSKSWGQIPSPYRSESTRVTHSLWLF